MSSEQPVKGRRANRPKTRKVSIAAPPAADLQEQVGILTRQLKEAREQQAATADVLKVISRSTFDLQAVLGTLVESAGRLCQAENVQIFLRNGEAYRLAADNGFSPEYQEYVRQHPIVPGRGTLVARTALEVVPVHLSDALADPEYTYHEGRRLGGYRTMLGIPLVRDENCIGVIALTRSEVCPFTQKQVELVATFADQAVIAIENTRLFNEVQERTRDLQESLQQQTATADVLKVISRSTFDLQAVLRTLVESAARLSGANQGTITRQKDGKFYRVESFNHSREFMDYVRDIPVALDRGSASGRALLAGDVVHITDVLADAEYTFNEAQRLSGLRTCLGVPVLREGIPVGVISLTRSEVRPFTDKQIELVKTFADQAAIAIENARLFEEVQARTRDLQESLQFQTASADVLKVISRSPDALQPVLDVIVTISRDLCHANSAVIFILRDNKFHVAAASNQQPEYFEPVRAKPIGLEQVGSALARAGREKRTVHIRNSRQDSESGLGGPLDNGPARSMLAVPLIGEGRVIGGISLGRALFDPFSSRQIEAIESFADQAVIAIQNVKLFDEVQAKTRDLQESLQQQTATSEVLQVISSSSGELEPVFNKMLENATSVCGAEFGTMTLNEDGGFRTVALYNAPKAYADTQLYKVIRPHPESGLSAVLKTHQPIHIADIRNEPPYIEGNANVRALADLGGARTLLIVPMLKENELIGSITIYRQEVNAFTDKQTELVSNFANQAVIAIENARLLNELRDRTEELSQSLDDLRTAQGRLVQTEKLASLGQLTAGIAHEIKNPLNFVNNFSALSVELTDELNDLLKQAAFAEQLRKQVDEVTGLLKSNLEKVVQHGKRADSIVKNMLLHSREGSGERRPAEINRLVEESLNLAYHGARAEQAGFSITLKHDLDPEAGTLDFYPQEMTRALLNLFANGFYAATKRKAEAASEDFEPVLSAATKNLGKSIEIRIRDNGNGIPPEVREKMFNPFFTTKPTGEGTGLGLSMTHDIIVKQHGGRIDVETEPGSFTEFVIILPRGDGTATG